jgi:hypothetical protein
MNAFLDAGQKNALLKELTNLEQELARRKRKTMELLLHPDFVEFDRSGTRYLRADVLRMLADTVLPTIEYGNVDLVLLAENVALLTYLTADADGNAQTLRSSVWVHTEVGWQMRFHQGTRVPEPNC